MAQSNDSTNSAKEDIEGMKKDIESLVQRLSSLKGKSGDVMAEQLGELVQVATKFKAKGEDKGKMLLSELSVSTNKHPVRNLMYAFGVGVVLSMLITK